jgi:hypothetical protein
VLVGKLTTADAAASFLKWRGQIDALVRGESEGFIAKVKRDGVYMWIKRNTAAG